MSANTASSSAPKPNMRRAVLYLRRLIPVASFLAVGVLLIILVGIAQRAGWIRPTEASSSAPAVAGAIYTCPMHPQIRQPAPGRCPICGMELVIAAGANGAKLDELAVTVEPAQRRLANIQTAEVASGTLQATLQTVGAIAIDESRQATISAYIDGRIERLFADYTGISIAKGDHLAVVYSPQLYAAQVEYLEARKTAQSPDGLPAVRRAQESLAQNTRQRLHEFGMTDEQIAQLEQENQAQSRLTIYSPQSGTVIEKLAVEGNYIKAGDPIYRIADLSTIWLTLELFPEDATRVRFGQEVTASLRSLQGETFLGRVAFIDPTVDPQTRTVGVRVELMNEHGKLRPGDYAEARIEMPIGPQGKIFDASLAGKWISPMHPQVVRDEPGECPICGMDLVPTSNYGFATEPVAQPISLYVPRSAVLLAGGNSVVYVETKPGRFEIRPVTVGPMLEDKIVILEGLQVGEKVATSGNFLIDSQMQLAGKPSLIDPTRAQTANQKPSGPLSLTSTQAATLPGETGQRLEEFYAAYFEVQAALASDKTPNESTAQTLHALATELAENSELPEPAVEKFRSIAKDSEHLPHMQLTDARKAFRSISAAVIQLASEIRGNASSETFTHFFCPMVPGGGGDWLQDNDRLLNPYFGSEMLRCGEKVHELEPGRPRSAESGKEPDAPPAQPKTETDHRHGEHKP